MTYTPDAETKERKLRAVRMAAASAINNGLSTDEIRAAVEMGISEARDLDARTGRATPRAA